MSKSSHLGFVRSDWRFKIERKRCKLRRRRDSCAAEVSFRCWLICPDQPTLLPWGYRLWPLDGFGRREYSIRRIWKLRLVLPSWLGLRVMILSLFPPEKLCCVGRSRKPLCHMECFNRLFCWSDLLNSVNFSGHFVLFLKSVILSRSPIFDFINFFFFLKMGNTIK